MTLRVRIIVHLLLLGAAAYLFLANPLLSLLGEDVEPGLSMTLQELRWARWTQIFVAVVCLVSMFCLRPWPSTLRRVAGITLLAIGCVSYVGMFPFWAGAGVILIALTNIAGIGLIPLAGVFLLIRWPSEYRTDTSKYEAFD